MKKLICILLSVIMCLCVPVFANADEACDCGHAPVVMVRGFGSPMFAVQEDGTQTALVSLATEDIMAMIPDIMAALGKLTLGDDIGFAKAVKGIVDGIADNLYCNPDGTSKNNIAVLDNTEVTAEVHLQTEYRFDLDQGGTAGLYVFEHDWRLDPTATADRLHAYIEEVKAVTKHEKVVLVAHSQGNIVATSYLAEYGNDSVEKVLFTSPAYQGLRLVGQLFTRDVSIEGKASAVTEFLDTFMRLNMDQQSIVTLIGVLDEAGVLDAVVGALDLFLDSTLDALYEYVLIDLFATMPGIWGFVPDAYYEEAKTVMLQKEEYKQIIPVIDAYHYGVQTEVPELLADLEKENIPFYIVAGYGIAPIPVYEDAVYQSDMLIDTDYMTLGATCAPTGELLSYEGDMLPAYFSPDLLIDASTCLYPDRTWFLRYQGHLDMCDAYDAFLSWLILSEGQQTVFANETYPQFMQCNE
ncbi:MAG: hypothetical protein IKM24_09205, partial [Clostridia bacterium]|nr:hypothetical protein [Clostridia bacterium]